MPLFDRAKKELGEVVDKVDDVVDSVVDRVDDVVDDVVDEVREHVPGGDKAAEHAPDDLGERAEGAVRSAKDSATD